MLSIKSKRTFLFLSFLMIGLCNSSANSLFEVVSFLIPPPKVYLTKNLQTIEASPR